MLRAARICQIRCVRLYSQFNPAENGFFDNQEDFGGDFNRMSNSRPPRRLGDQKSFFYQHAKQERSVTGERNFVRRNHMSVSGFHGRSLNNALGASLSDLDWNKLELSPIVKNLYKEQDVVSQRTEDEIKKWREENEVTLEGSNVPRPVFGFDEVGFPKLFTERLSQSFEKPTCIQSLSWPAALSGRDMISIAYTGSGKTLGFILPGILHTLAQPGRNNKKGPTVVVLLPTRELAQQVEVVAQPFCRAAKLAITSVFGGASKNVQAMRLQDGVDVLIATPGRMLDLLEAKVLSLSNCSYLVFDEADRMLDMGFEPQIRKVVSQIRPDRQTLMFSATWPKEVQALAADFQKDPVFLNVGSLELSANHDIKQKVEVIDNYHKRSRFVEIIDEALEDPKAKIMVFMATKQRCDDLSRFLRHDGRPSLAIHGGKTQRERDWVLNEFKTGKSKIILATDVAARGLDVDDVTLVVNYDYPNTSADYIHRIGRTGRRGKSGVAHTLFTPDENAKVHDLIKVLTEAGQEVPEQLQELAQSTYRGGFQSGYGKRTYTREQGYQYDNQRNSGGFNRYGGNSRNGGNSRYGGGNSRFGRRDYDDY